MCGIYGIWHTDGRHVDLAALQGATDRLRHRGPDDEGFLLVDSKGGAADAFGGPDTDRRLSLPRLAAAGATTADLALGFRRLSILDLSPAGHQPMAGAACWMVFNGEIYNYLELRDELRAHGHSFRSGGDSEVILAAYRQWGPACLERLNGMWAFAIWDAGARRLFIARDRFGIKPLYYSWDGRTLRFASEIKALVGAYGAPFAPDEQAIYRYLAGGLLPSPREGKTFFRDVRALPAGHVLLVEAGQARERHYWSLEPDDGGALDAATAIERYRALFDDALRLQLRSDVAIGTCLSGGVDSSSIVCAVNGLMQGEGLSAEQIGARQKTFSAVYERAGPFNERPYIERVIAATGAEANYTIPTAERLWQDAEALVWHQDEPFLSTSIFAQWCVMSAVRARGVTVLLDGQGADETLAGYRPFEAQIGDRLRRGRLGQALAEALAMQARTDRPPLPALARALALQAPGPLLDAGYRLRRLRSPVAGWLDPAFAARWGHEGPADWWRWSGNRTLSQQLTTQVEESSLPHLLRYEDRNSMAFGVEARVPFLDHRLVQFAFGGGAPYRIHKGWTKWLLRKALEERVPDPIIWRKSKIGFETPEAEWLARWSAAGPALFGPGARSAAYLDLPTVRSQLAASTASHGDRWRLINLELWLKVWGQA